MDLGLEGRQLDGHRPCREALGYLAGCRATEPLELQQCISAVAPVHRDGERYAEQDHCRDRHRQDREEDATPHGSSAGDVRTSLTLFASTRPDQDMTLSLGRAHTAAAMITSKVVGLLRLSWSRAPSAWASERARARPIP